MIGYYGWRSWRWTHPDLHTRLQRITAPTAEAVTLAEVVAHLRLDPGADTGPEAALLTGMRDAAVGHLERYCSYSVMEQEWQMTARSFPPYGVGLTLPYPPTVDLRSIEVAGDALDLADFTLERDDRLPATLFPVGGVWPHLAWSPGPGAIAIRWTAGRDDPAELPQEIKQAILLAVASWYENRESLTQFALTPMLELGWDSLLSPYRETGFA